MWRIVADVNMEILANEANGRNFRIRDNPIESLSDGEFEDRYRFPKFVLLDLLEILDPALERHTHR